MESIPLLIQKFTRKDKKKTTLMEKNKVRSAIENICKEYLLDFDDIIAFEALPDVLDHTLAVITEQELNERYEFSQESETIFYARLREIDF